LSLNKASFDVSQAAQTIIFTVDAFDASGINWSSPNTVLAMKDQGGSSHYARGSDEEPGKLFLSVNSSDQEGIWEVAYLALMDTLGNRSLFMIDELLASGFLAYISEVGGIEIIGGVESTPPTLSALTLNKASFDVSQAPQTIIFTVDAFGESGINWSAGPNKSNIIMQDQQFGYHYAIGDDNAPGTLSVAVTQNDNAGRWKILRLELTDSVGNKETVQLSDLELLGLPSFVYVLAPEEEVTDLSLIAGSQDTAVAQGADFTRVLNIENLADTDTDQLTFELSSTNMSVQSVSLISGSSSCSISTVNYNSTVSCSMSGVPANTSKSISVNFKAGIVGVGSFNANVVGALPDISYLDNYLSAEVNVVADGDGDGIADVSDNCADTANSNQVDTDSDSSGDACDFDDDDDDGDGDGVADSSDAFPLDLNETTDTDSDGVGNNADTDDDGDGVLDANDAYPLISLNGLMDTDLDGLPNECDSDCLDTGMTADADDDGDGVNDAEDAFTLDSSEQIDTDGDGIGDNADPYPEFSDHTLDSDSDGMPDAWEARYGLDPNDPSDASSDQDNDGVSAYDEFIAGTIPSGSLDLDGNGQYDALTDGLLLLRGMFGLSEGALISGAVASDAAYTSSSEIVSRIDMLGDLVDIDGNGRADALTDGLIILRYLFGLRGDVLINGVVAPDASITSADGVGAKVESLMPAL